MHIIWRNKQYQNVVYVDLTINMQQQKMKRKTSVLFVEFGDTNDCYQIQICQ